MLQPEREGRCCVRRRKIFQRRCCWALNSAVDSFRGIYDNSNLQSAKEKAEKTEQKQKQAEPVFSEIMVAGMAAARE